MDDLPRPLSGGIPNVNIPTPPHPPHESGATPPRLSNVLFVKYFCKLLGLADGDFSSLTGNGVQLFEAQGALPKQIFVPRNSGRMAHANSSRSDDRWAFAVGNASWWSAALLSPFPCAQKFSWFKCIYIYKYTPHIGGSWSYYWLAWLANKLLEKSFHGWMQLKGHGAFVCSWKDAAN